MKCLFLSLAALFYISGGAVSLDSTVVASSDSSSLAAGVQLGNVVVYGGKNNFGVRSSQMSAITVSNKQILSVPVFLGDPDVLKSLQKFPGVQSGSDGTAGIFVRGGDYDQNYITLDGSAIYNAEHMRGYVSAINPDMIRSLNFYRGAFPARYGSRLSSVVDVGIKEGDFNSYHGLLSIGVLSGRLQAEGPILKGHTSFNVAARMSYFDLIAKPVLEQFYDRKEAMQPYSNMKFFDVTAKIVHKFNERNRLSAVFYYGKDVDEESPTESNRYINTIGDWSVLTEKQCREIDYRMSSNSSRWSNLLASVYFTSRMNDNHLVNVNLNYSQYVYDMSNTNTINSTIDDVYRLYYLHNEQSSISTHSGIKDLSLTADATLRLGDKHLLRYGVKLSRQWLKPSNVVDRDVYVKLFRGGLNYDGDESLVVPAYDESSEHVHYSNGEEMTIYGASAYCEDDFALMSKLKLNYGLRLSSYFVTAKSQIEIEPRVSLRYLIADNLSVKASYSRMSQGIHRLVTNNLVMPSDIWVPITKDVPLMKSDLYGFGVNYDVLGLNFAAETYYKTFSNVLEYRNGASYFIANQNWKNIVALGDGRSYGFEFLVEKKVGSTTGWLSYTWSKSLRKFDRPGEEINGGREFYSSSDHRNNLSLNLSHHFTLSKKLGLDLSASWSYQTGRRGTVPYVITYGQSVVERAGSIPVVAYGDVLFKMAGWRTVLTSDSPWGTITGVAQSFNTFRDVNDFKLPDTHHLDLGASLTWTHKLGESTFGLNLYNVYNHYNVSNVYVGYKDNKVILKGVCPFPFMPSISVTQKF